MRLQADGDAVAFGIGRRLRQTVGDQIDHLRHRLSLGCTAAERAHVRRLQIVGQRQISAQVCQMLGAVLRVR